MYDSLQLSVPKTGVTLRPGCKVKLNRFETETWVVSYGWYSWGGNRPVCGWFLMCCDKPSTIKPLQLTDLDDIYLVTV